MLCPKTLMEETGVCLSFFLVSTESKTKEIVVAIVGVKQCLWHWSRHGGRHTQLTLKGFGCSWVTIHVVSFGQGQHWVSVSLSVREQVCWEPGSSPSLCWVYRVIGQISHLLQKLPKPTPSSIVKCDFTPRIQKLFPTRKCALTHTTMHLKSHFSYTVLKN